MNFPFVGELRGTNATGGTEIGTGSVVSSDAATGDVWILTAAHVAQNSGLAFLIGNRAYDVTEREIDAQWEIDAGNGGFSDGTETSDMTTHDVALVEVNSRDPLGTAQGPVPGEMTYPLASVTRVPIATGIDYFYRTGTIPETAGAVVGFGVSAYNGDGSPDSSTSQTERAGWSEFDASDPNFLDASADGTTTPQPSGPSGMPDPLSVIAAGDSGGPVLVDVPGGGNGGYAIAAIATTAADGMPPTAFELRMDEFDLAAPIFYQYSPAGEAEAPPAAPAQLYSPADFMASGLTYALPTSLASPADSPPGAIPAIANDFVQAKDSGLQQVAVFADPAGPGVATGYAAQINWGDGAAGSPDITAGTISGPDGTGLYTVSGDHDYSGFGEFTVTVTVSRNSGGGSVTTTETINVYEAPLIATGGLSLTGTYGTALNGVEVATFTDPSGLTPNPLASTYVALITWGGPTTANDVTTIGTVTEIGSTDEYDVTGNFTYYEQTDISPDYTVSVEIFRDVPGQRPNQLADPDPDPAPATVTDTATLAYPKLVGSGKSIEVVQRVSSGEEAVATFTDPGKGQNVGEYSASINWGDGTPLDTSTLQISGPGNGGVYTVDGDHTYSEPGKYTITVDLNHLTAPTDVVTSQATIIQNIGMLLLDRSGASSFLNSGNGALTITGNGDLVIDSSSSTAAIQSGNGNVSAVEIDAVGKLLHSGGGNFFDSVAAHPPATPDPLAALGIIPPSASALGLRAYAAVKATNSQTITLSPGVYTGGISISGSAKVILNPGVYILSGGGLSISGNGALTGSDVMLYNAPNKSGGQINLAGNAKLALTAPSPNSPLATGKPFESEFQGISLFQDPASTIPILVSGSASFNVTGVIYAAKAALTMSSTANSYVQGDSTKLFVSAGIVVYDFSRSGNGSLIINAAANQSLNVAPILGQAIGTVAPAIVKQIQVVAAANVLPASSSNPLTTVTSIPAAAVAVGSGATAPNPEVVDSVFDEIGRTGIVLR